MVKKLLRMTMTFVVLLAAYNGYSRGFTFLTGFVAKPRTVPELPIVATQSDGSKETDRLAAAAFGPDHWSVRAPLRYYSVIGGYCIYYRDQVRSTDGKSWEFSPVAVIVQGKSGELKTITGDKAKLDFNHPFDMSGKAGDEPAYVTHATISGNVNIRADKGTPSIADDLVIGPQDSFEFDDKTEQIISRGEERIVLRQGGTTVSGIGLTMLLRRKPKPLAGESESMSEAASAGGPGTGFEGVRTISLLRDVEIDVLDVGRSGIVPGGATVSATATKGGASKPVKFEPKPGHIQCLREMRIDLPPTRIQPAIGPPSPPDPTYATFVGNVRVTQGVGADLDQLDCDRLETVLLPPEPNPDAKKKVAAADRDRKARNAAEATVAAKSGATTKGQAKAKAEPADDEEQGGAISNLSLHRAHATGHAVWLQSTSQNMRGVGNELRFEKFGPTEPDRVYFRGDKQTEIVKTDFFAEGKNAGKPKSVDTIRTKDVTLFRYPPGGPAPSVVARGPGTLETRAAGSDEVERFASWRDELKMVSVLGTDMRKVTLTGHPRVRSTSQGDISADKEIVADLMPRTPAAPLKVASIDGRVAPAREASASPGTKGDAMRLKHVRALGNVHLVTVETAADPKANPPRAASPRREVVARNEFETSFLDAPATPKANTPARVKTATADAPPELAEIVDAATPAVVPEPKAPEPGMTAIADKVTAVVLQQAGTDKGQVEEAKLIGHAEVHQDPAEGKSQGSDLFGHVIYVWNKGENRARIQAQGTVAEPALAVTEGREIRGRILQLDQADDHAWVIGMGRLKMEQAGTDFLDDTAKLAAAPAKGRGKADDEKKPKKGPLIITWGLNPDDKAAMMHFYGRTTTKDGRPGPAQAIFYSHVLAKTDDSSARCEDRMTTTFDAPIPFVRPKRDPAEEKARKARGELEPKPQIATVLLEKDAEVVARTLDPATGFVKDKKRILHDKIFYDKAIGEFVAKGSPGEVFLYSTSTKDDPGPPLPMANERRTVKPATVRVDGAKLKKPATQPPLTLTHVRFQKSMDGRFSSPKDAKPGDYSDVFFTGSVEAMSAKVKDEDEVLDADSPPEDFYRLVSPYMTINVEPPPTKDPKAKDRVLLDAWPDAKALTRDKTISGDRITYDSLSELSYVYGGANGDVLIQNQDGAGQPISRGRGAAVRYNHKTGQHQLINPKTFDLIDPKSGKRSVLTPYEPGPMESRNVRALEAPGRPVKPRDPNDPVFKAKQLRLPPRSGNELRGFSGR